MTGKGTHGRGSSDPRSSASLCVFPPPSVPSANAFHARPGTSQPLRRVPNHAWERSPVPPPRRVNHAGSDHKGDEDPAPHGGLGGGDREKIPECLLYQCGGVPLDVSSSLSSSCLFPGKGWVYCRLLQEALLAGPPSAGLTRAPCCGSFPGAPSPSQIYSRSCDYSTNAPPRTRAHTHSHAHVHTRTYVHMRVRTHMHIHTGLKACERQARPLARAHLHCDPPPSWVWAAHGNSANTDRANEGTKVPPSGRQREQRAHLPPCPQGKVQNAKTVKNGRI